MKNIDAVYTGAMAAKYDRVRTESKRWIREAEVIGPMLRSLPEGASLIDVAAGTGRWLAIYKERGIVPVLIDSSQDMLAQAATKAAALGVPARIVCESALSPAPFPEATYALITNFFNWISLPNVETVLRKIRAARILRILFMISYFPADAGPVLKFRKNLSLACRNFRSHMGWHEKGHYHLHAERDVRALLDRLGLAVQAEQLIVARRYKRNVMLDVAVTPPPAP